VLGFVQHHANSYPLRLLVLLLLLPLPLLLRLLLPPSPPAASSSSPFSISPLLLLAGVEDFLASYLPEEGRYIIAEKLRVHYPED
jgi:hypothetical protein